MVKEDYVSFETAKLLKEKEFDGYSTPYFSKIEGDLVPQSVAMKWLREEYSIIIVVEPHMFDWDTYTASNYVFCLWYGDNYKEPYSDQHSNIYEVTYNSYEEAVEAALRYSLENLI